MKIILDTNVLVSGLFFKGNPSKIVELLRNRKIDLILSIEIFDEYKRISKEFRKRYPGFDLERIFEIIGEKSQFYIPKNIEHDVCKDPNDQMFLNCAIISKTKVIVTGDKGLLKISGFKGIDIITPRAFIEKYFKK